MNFSFKHIDYNRLRIYLEVCNNLSITKASQILGRTQSAISQSIQKLEEELGIDLIEIIERKVTLTPKGEEIYTILQQHFPSLENILLKALNQTKEIEGTIKVGILHDSSTNFNITEAIINFQKNHPRVKLEIDFGTSKDIEDKLFNNQLDFGLLINFKRSHYIQKIAITEERHYLCASNKNMRTHNNFNPIQNIYNVKLIDLTPQFLTLKSWLQKFYPKEKYKLNDRSPNISLPSFSLNKDLILKGDTVGILPEQFIQSESEIQTIPPNKSKFLTVRLDLAYRKIKSLTTTQEIFKDFLCKYVNNPS